MHTKFKKVKKSLIANYNLISVHFNRVDNCLNNP